MSSQTAMPDREESAMEKLARELMDAVCDCSPAAYHWLGENSVYARGKAPESYKKLARSDIERRIEAARAEDEAEGQRLLSVLREALLAAGDERDALRAELDALRGAGRVMPEGLAWPRYTDGSLAMPGDVRRGTGRERHEYRVVGAAAGCGRMSAVCVDADDGGALVLVDPADLEPPDSWERLTKDAGKSTYDYWMCNCFECHECPAAVGGKDPGERYGCLDCGVASRLDLLARAKRLAGVSE